MLKSIITPYSLTKSEHDLLAEDARKLHLRKILEFGPGVSTLAFIQAGANTITSLEYNPEWVAKYADKFSIYRQVRVLLFENTPHISVPETDDERYDACFVDSPTGGMFKKFSRINAALYAAAHTNRIYLHDVDRPAEQRTIAVLEDLGWSMMASFGRIARLHFARPVYKVLPRNERK